MFTDSVWIFHCVSCLRPIYLWAKFVDSRKESEVRKCGIAERRVGFQILVCESCVLYISIMVVTRGFFWLFG